MKKHFIIPLLLFVGSIYQAAAQVEEVIDFIIEESAIFPGGEQAMLNYFTANIQYPPEAKQLGVQGEVYAQFIVHADGRLSQFKVVHDIGSGCGEEVVRVLKQMPRWRPATMGGKAVSTLITLPVAFTIAKDADATKQKAKTN